MPETGFFQTKINSHVLNLIFGCFTQNGVPDLPNLNNPRPFCYNLVSQCALSAFVKLRLLEYREAVRACTMRRSSVIQVHSLFLLFLCVFRAVSPFYLYLIVYSIYTTICTIVTHPFASGALRDNQKSYLLPTKTSMLANLISTGMPLKFVLYGLVV